MDFLKSAGTFLLAMFLTWTIGWFSGFEHGKHPTQNLTCVEDRYEVVSKPGCYLTAYNIVSGMPDGETGWFKNFDQIGVCGTYACKGQAQGTYECFELNKLRKQVEK